MARVFIDAHMFSEHWFKTSLAELLKCKKVLFTYSESEKLNEEISKVRQALQFFKLAGELKDDKNRSRRVDAPANDVELHQEKLESMPCFSSCADCDDPHIFALIYVKPTPYVFSKDARIARCRDAINPKIESRYCGFAVISNAAIYAHHRQAILS